MRKLFYLLLLLTFASVAQAQTSPTGSAATYYRMFNKNIEKLKTTDYETSKGSFKSQLSQASQNLANIKKNDPQFDATPLEKELKKYSSIADAASSSQNLARDRKALEDRIAILKASSGPDDSNWGSKMDYVESKLKILKTRNPNFDASGYEKEIAEITATASSSASDSKAGQDKEDQFRSKYDELLGETPTFSAHSESELSALKSKVSKLDRSITDFVYSDLASVAKGHLSGGSNATLRAARSKMNRLANNELKARDMNSFSNTMDLAVTHTSIQGYYAQAKGINKLYGSDTEVKADFMKIDRFVKSIPSLSSLNANAVANRGEMISKRRMTPAVDNSPALIEEFKAAFIRGKFSASNQIVAVHVTSKSWRVNRNVRKEILNRTKEAEIVVKESNGQCYLYPFTMVQDYAAGSYSAGRSHYKSYNKVDILCENVK